MNLSINNYLTEQSYNTEAYKELMEFLDKHSLNDGDKFCADLMRESPRHKSLGMLLILFLFQGMKFSWLGNRLAQFWNFVNS